MERRSRWKDHVKTTPYISPLQTFSSNGIYQEARQKTFQCPVCLGRYLEQEEHPEKLPCDHIICLLCYKNIKDQGVIHCPICQVQHKFIRKGIALDSDSEVSKNNVSSFDSSQSLDFSEISLEMQRDQTDILIETNQCHDHSLKKLDLYCNIHDIRISSECEHDKHISNDCTVISCEQEMKGRKLKAGNSIDSKVHLMTKLNSRIKEFLDTLKKEDPRNSPDVEDQIRAVHGLLEEVKLKQIFLSDSKREIEQQETWENLLSACGDADLKLLYTENSLKDMYTKLEAIKLHYSVRQQIGYGETPVNNDYEKIEHEVEERSSKSKPKATENNGNSKQFPCSIQKSEHQVTKEQEDEINANTVARPDRTDGSMSKIKHEKKSQILQEKDFPNSKTNIYHSYQLISLTDNAIEQAVFHEETSINEYEPDDLSQEADGLGNMTHITNESIAESLENDLNPEKKYKPLYNDNHNFHEAINIKYIVDKNDANPDVFDKDVNISKSKHGSNNTTYDTARSLITVTKGIDSKILLEKLLSDTKRQKDIKMSEVNKLTVCLFSMFILSYIFYFLFSRENNIIKDDLNKALSQKEELENLIADSLSEINALQQKLDDTISQRNFFHLKLNEALIMQGRKLEIQELPQMSDKESSWYSWIGLLLYNMFYFTFKMLMLTGSFIIISLGGEMLNEEYVSMIISTDSITKSISMVVCFLILYEVCGIVTWVTNLPLVASPLFNWYQQGNLFIVGGIRMCFYWLFAYSGLMTWLSTAVVGIIVLALSVYIMSELSKNMKSRGVDKQNHDAFFIITWPILAFAFSVFLAWLSILPLT